MYVRLFLLFTAPCIDGTLRLTGGFSSLDGRVEICYNGVYGTVCDDAWGFAEATVVCRQLGFNTTGKKPGLIVTILSWSPLYLSSFF